MSSDSQLVTYKIPDFANWKLNEAKLENMPALQVQEHKYSNGHVIRKDKKILNPDNTIVELVNMRRKESQIGEVICLLSILYNQSIADVKHMLKVDYWNASIGILQVEKMEVLLGYLSHKTSGISHFKDDLLKINLALRINAKGIQYQFEVLENRRSNIKSNLYTTRLQAHTQELRRKGWHEQRYTTRLPATRAPPTLDSFNSF